MKKPSDIKNVIEVTDKNNASKVHVFFESGQGVFYNQKIHGDFFYDQCTPVDELHGYFHLYQENKAPVKLNQFRAIVKKGLADYWNVTVIKRDGYLVVRSDACSARHAESNAKTLAWSVSQLGFISKPNVFHGTKALYSHTWVEALVPA